MISAKPLAGQQAGNVRPIAGSTMHITAREWRWVLIVTTCLVTLAFLPLLWVALADGEFRLMGVLHNYLDGGTYFSKMQIGMAGGWLVEFLHTPEPLPGALIQTLYPFLGHVAQASGLSIPVIFHVARAAAAVFMYCAIYVCAAAIWSRVSMRRLFFVVACVSAGLGWLFAGALNTDMIPDFALLPEAFPFYSSLMNVHFPLAIAGLSLIAGLLIGALRPGAELDATFRYGWVAAGVLSLGLSVLYPQALVPLIGAVTLYAGIDWFQKRRFPVRVARYWVALVLPALPMAVYLGTVVSQMPAFAQWNQQNVTPAPSVVEMLLGFAIPLIIAVPGIIRASRRFEADGDRLMLLWLICIIVCIYLPTNIQRRFAAGIMLPIAYFAVRAVSDYWRFHVPRRIQRPVLAATLAVSVISPLLVLILPAAAAVGAPQQVTGLVLERDYAPALDWLEPQVDARDVILAAPTVGIWVPGFTGGRVVYAHPYETLDAEQRRLAVESWFAQAAGADCQTLLGSYRIRYVIVGPRERALGEAACANGLRIVRQFGEVAVYAG
jgi:hypothetical protein